MNGLGVIAAAINDDAPDISTWAWATVTATSPLRVKLDGESTALDITPDTLAAALAVNDRVWVQLVTNDNPARKYCRLFVLGRAGGRYPALTGRAASTSATLASVSSTTAVAVLTISSHKFVDKHAYLIKVKGFQTSGTAQGVRHQIKTVSTSGTIIGDLGDCPIISTASGGEVLHGEIEVRNNSGSDVTADVLWCFQLQTGTATANVVSRNSSPCYVEIWDLGNQALYPNAKQV